MLIYVDQISERLVYTLQFVFVQRGLEVKTTNDKYAFESFSGKKLNYSDWPLDNVPQLKPATLLFEEQLDFNINIQASKWNETECLSINGVTDPLASIFYCLSRYEEYLPFVRDKHERFQAKDSCLVQFGWVELQIVERWIHVFLQTFDYESLNLLKSKQTVRFIPSFDIDNTFAYQWKEGWRTWLSVAKDTLLRNALRSEERKEVQQGIKQDPYDCYDYLAQVAVECDETRFFWLLGDFAEYDKNITWSDPRHQRLIRRFATISSIGLHPSYASNLSDKKLAIEAERITQILGKRVVESRQHFLKLQFPSTYLRLQQLGFQRDFSMGFAEQPGFRAGTAHPHFFFNLHTNLATSYEIVPFAYMDGTFREYQQISIDESKQKVTQLAKEVKEFGGVFCCVWHNETIAEAGKWKGWRALFEHTKTLFDAPTD